MKDIVFSCGSGVTACVLALAYSLINDKYLPKIYDGSGLNTENLNLKKNTKTIYIITIIFFNNCNSDYWSNNDWKSFQKKIQQKPPPGIIVTKV